MGVPANLPFTWQLMQGTVTCAPVSGNPVCEWSNVAPCQVEVEWQVWHVVGNPAVAWLGFVVPVKSFWLL